MKKESKSSKNKPAQGQDSKNLLGQAAETLKENLNITPQTVTKAVVQDAKQAVNYEIRRGFRDILKGIFSK